MSPRRCTRLLFGGLVLALAVLALPGCVDVSETWTLARNGSGTYAARLRWNAGLLTAVRSEVGERVFDAFAGRAFPLRLEDWREGLRGLANLDVVRLEERVEVGGWRVLEAEVRFGRLEDLLRWEVLARRTLRVDPPDEDRRVRLTMEPFTRLPVLDPLLSALRAYDERPASDASPLASERADETPWGALDLKPGVLAALERRLRPAVAEVRLNVEVQVAGTVRSANSPAVRAEGSVAAYRFTADDLAPGRSRRLEIVYVPGEFDAVPLVDHEGDAASDGPSRRLR